MSATASQHQSRIARLREYLAQDPGNVNLLLEIADLSIPEGDLAGAREAASTALQAVPGNAYARSLLSTIALAQQNWSEAIEIGLGLLADGHNVPPVRYNLGRALLFAGRHAEASAHLEPLVGRSDVPHDAIQLAIRARHYQGDIEAAVALAKTHLERHPADNVVAGMLSLLYIDADDLPAAQALAEQTLRENPGSLDALLAAGTARLGFEDDAGADQAFDAALALRADNGRAWSGKAVAKLLRLDLAGARADFERSVRVSPEHIGSWIALAWVQYLSNDVDAAEASFNQALTLDDTFSESQGGMALIAAARGDWAAAERAVKTALRLDPQSFTGRYVQSLQLKRSGREARAQQIIDTAMKDFQVPGGGSLAEMMVRVTARRR